MRSLSNFEFMNVACSWFVELGICISLVDNMLSLLIKILLHYYFWFLMYILLLYCWLLFEYAVLDFRSIIYIRLKNHRLKWPDWGENSVKWFKGRVLVSLSVEWQGPPLCPAVLGRLGNAADGPALLRRNGPSQRTLWIKHESNQREYTRTHTD